MKKISIIFFLGVLPFLNAQTTYYNVSKGFVASGYDVTEYFNTTAKKGNNDYVVDYDGAKFKFASKENMYKFKADPEKFIPEYGGYCAYAIGVNGEKVSVNPKTFDVRDGKLYLFYNSLGVNTLKKWNKEGAEALREKANLQWDALKHKE